MYQKLNPLHFMAFSCFTHISFKSKLLVRTFHCFGQFLSSTLLLGGPAVPNLGHVSELYLLY